MADKSIKFGRDVRLDAPLIRNMASLENRPLTYVGALENEELRNGLRKFSTFHPHSVSIPTIFGIRTKSRKIKMFC